MENSELEFEEEKSETKLCPSCRINMTLFEKILNENDALRNHVVNLIMSDGYSDKLIDLVVDMALEIKNLRQEIESKNNTNVETDGNFPS